MTVINGVDKLIYIINFYIIAFVPYLIAGKRAPLAGKIQEAYGVSKDEAEKQLADFQKRMKEISHVKSDKGADATLRGAQ